MKETVTDNERQGKLPQFGFDSISVHFNAEALQWFEGTTNTQDGEVSNRKLFYDLLSRMRLTNGQDESFRRPQNLLAGQAQFSEIGLAEEWHLGRKKAHNLLTKLEQLNIVRIANDRIASVMTFVCVAGWNNGGYVKNPFYLYADKS